MEILKQEVKSFSKRVTLPAFSNQLNPESFLSVIDLVVNDPAGGDYAAALLFQRLIALKVEVHTVLILNEYLQNGKTSDNAITIAKSLTSQLLQVNTWASMYTPFKSMQQESNYKPLSQWPAELLS